jgi:signal transduction histidine kinase
MAHFLLPAGRMDSPPNVLIVDDEPGVRESLRAILTGECSVHTAESGAEALTLIETVPVDVVTLDLRMPGLGGISVLERIKAYDPDIEALIITGYNSFDAAVDSMRLRAFDYVSKPFDVDHVRALVRRAAARRRAVRRLRHAKHELFANLSDAFRTPLNVILGYTEMLRDVSDQSRDLDAEQREALDRICANSSSLVQYLDGIFLLAELEAGDRPLVPAEVHIDEVLNSVTEAQRDRAAVKHLRLNVASPTDLVVETDRGLLTLLLANLVDNAVKFTERGEVSVGADVVTAGDGITIWVRDTGIGVDAAIIEAMRAHDGAGTTQLRTPHSGVALGLPTAAAIARQLGGRITVKGTQDLGSEFRLNIPWQLPISEPLIPIAARA